MHRVFHNTRDQYYYIALESRPPDGGATHTHYATYAAAAAVCRWRNAHPQGAAYPPDGDAELPTRPAAVGQHHKETTMPRITTTLLGYTAWLDDDGAHLTASYEDEARLLDELTIVLHERELIGDVWRPEETDIDAEAYGTYFDALVAWVAKVTGLPAEELAEAWHPDVPEPYLRYTR